MTIDSTAAVSGAASGGGVHSRADSTQPPKQALDNEVFLHLLVTQLRNQDPSSPMDTNQMIAQSTQLAMMEQLSTLSSTSGDSFSLQMRSTAATLLGRTVEYLDDGGGTGHGLVESVSFAGAVPQLLIGGTAVRLDAVLGLIDPTITDRSTV